MARPEERKTPVLMYEILFIAAAFCFIYTLYQNGIILQIVCFVTIYIAYRNIVSLNSKILPVNEKAVFVTGCDSGFGFELAKYLLEQNYQVFAGCLDPYSSKALELPEYCARHSQLHVLKLDVCDKESVRQCAGIIREFCCEKGLWALVNNAGIDRFGGVEFATMEMFEKVMDVNYFGIVRTTKELLPLIRMAKGRIVNVTSMQGRVSIPYRTAYCPSKFAIESFSDILRLELQPFGVKVCIIEPGHFGGATKILDSQNNFLQNSLELMWESASEDVRMTYGREYLNHLRNFVKEGVQTSSTNIRPVVEAMYHAIQSSTPKYRYLIGGGYHFFDINTILVHAASFLPEAVMDYILQKLYLSNWPIPQSLRQEY